MAQLGLRRWAIVLVGLCAFALGLMACAGSDGTSVAESSSSGHVIPHKDKKAARMENSRTRASCLHARVTLGQSDGAIDIAVKCAGGPGGKSASFSLSRYSLQGKRSKQGIVAVRKRPVVLGPGASTATRAHARCVRHDRGSWTRDVVDCSVPARRPVEVKARIWVKPRLQCSMGISVTSAKSSKCTGKICYSDYEFVSLSRGRPRGC